MRTTLNVDDDVLRAAREIARLRASTVGGILSELARSALERERPAAPEGVRNGVPLLAPSVGEGIVTPEAVRALRGDA